MRKIYLSPPYVMALMVLFIFFSCKKDTMKTAETDNPSKLVQANVTNRLQALTAVYPTASNNNDSVETPTIIDYQLPNPYTIANMQQAYKKVTGQNITPAVTNLYVRFKPSDVGQLRVLDSTAEAQGLELFDEPLDYHVVQEGDYYQDPTVPMEEITWQYAVVPPNFSFPAGITYQLLASIHIPTDMSVEAEAERLVGLNTDGDDYNAGAAAAAGSQTQTATATIQPNVLQCGVGYHWDFTVNKCVPDNCASGYHWDNTKQTCVPDAPPPPPPSYIPGGRIQVWDSQLDNPTQPASPLDPNFTAQPLRTALVIARRWFKVERTYTDNNGAFQVTKNFRNKVKLYVKFKNQYASIRGIRGIRLYQMVYPIRRKIGIYTSTSINTVRYTFLRNTNPSSIGNRYWAGATTHNAIQEHKDYAAQFSFAAAPTDMHIYLTNWGAFEGLASTPLFHKRFIQDLPDSYINTMLVASAPLIAGGNVGLHAIFARVNVDMAIDYHRGDANLMTSDWLKETVYHESSHASHYSRAGTGWYTSFVNAELSQMAQHPLPNDPLNPYGASTSPDAPIIAVGEGWAYHMGYFLADQKYGASIAGVDNQGFTYRRNGDIVLAGTVVANTGLNPYINLLEDFSPRRTDVDPFFWIPKGLMWDLTDNRNDNNAIPLRVPLDDNVSAYTIGQLFNALQSDITSLPSYKTRLLSQNGNNQAAGVNTIFTFYGY